MRFSKSVFGLVFLFACTLGAASAVAAPASPAAKPEASAPSATKTSNSELLHWQELPGKVTLDLELRSRPEEQTALGYVNDKDRLYELTRVRGSIQYNAFSWLTAFAQFHDMHALGLPQRDTASNMKDYFDLRLGYLNFHYEDKVQAIAGRQVLQYGDERVVGVPDWSNTARSWDGFRLRLAAPKASLDLFSTSVVAIHPVGLDTHGAGLTFHGAEGNVLVTPKTSVMPFVLVRAYPSVKSQQKVYGSEVEATFGSEWDAKLPFGFKTTGLGDIQRGSYSNDSIHAGAGIARLGYAAPVRFTPTIEGEYDYATGNPHKNANRISTYDQQYPKNHNAFGLVDLFGFENIQMERLSVGAVAPHKWTLLFQGESLQVANKMDNVYSSSGGTTVTAPKGGYLHDGIGSGFDAQAKHYFGHGLDTNIGVGHFFPGYVMTSRSKGAPLTLVYAQLNYHFTVVR